MAVPAVDKLIGIPSLAPLFFGGAEEPGAVGRVILAVVAKIFGQLPCKAESWLIARGLIILCQALNNPPAKLLGHDPRRHRSIGRVFAARQKTAGREVRIVA